MIHLSCNWKKSCSRRCKSFKVSIALCGFQHSSLLTYSLNHLPLFPLFLALFINSCTVNSPWPSSSHFTLSLSLFPLTSLLFYYEVVQTERAKKIYLKAVAAKSMEKASLSVWRIVKNVPGALLQIALMDYCHLRYDFKGRNHLISSPFVNEIKKKNTKKFSISGSLWYFWAGNNSILLVVTSLWSGRLFSDIRGEIEPRH